MWFDAADTNTIVASGSNVSSWSNKAVFSPTVTITPNASGLSSTTGNVGPNGLNYINIPSGGELRFTTTIATQPRSWFFVVRNNTQLAVTTGYMQLIYPAGATTGQDNVYVYRSGASAYSIYNQPLAVGVRVAGTVLNPFNTVNIYSVINSTTTLSNAISSNGTNIGLATNVAASGYTTANVTYSINTYNQYQGSLDIFEMMFFTRAVSLAERQQLESYLAWKWGQRTTFPLIHPYRNALASARQFTPLDIAGCSLWVDATESNRITQTSGTVSSYLAAGYSAATLSNGTGFTWNQTLFNSKYPSFYNGTSNSANRVGSNATFSRPQPSTILFAGQALPGPFSDMFDSANAAARQLGFYFGTPIALRSFAGTTLIPTITASGDYVVDAFVFSGATSEIYENGTRVASGNAGTQAMTGLVLGNRYNLASESFLGHICDFLIYDRVLTTAERQQLEGYLAHKWGLRSYLTASHPFKNTIPIGTSFNPRQIANLNVWLDAADPSTLTFTGSNVTQWNDKSGSNRNAVIVASTGVVGATLNTTYIPGRPMLDFVQSLYNITYTSFPTSYTIFTVQYNTNNTAGNAGYQRLINASNADSRIFVGTLYGNVAAFNGNGTTWNDTNSIAVNNYLTPRIVEMVVSGASLNLYTEGNLGVTKVGTTATFNNLWLGYGTTGQDWYGGVGEILIYAAALTAEQRHRVEGYLTWKWNLQGNLPSIHSYKRINPI